MFILCIHYLKIKNIYRFYIVGLVRLHMLVSHGNSCKCNTLVVISRSIEKVVGFDFVT